MKRRQLATAMAGAASTAIAGYLSFPPDPSRMNFENEDSEDPDRFDDGFAGGGESSDDEIEVQTRDEDALSITKALVDIPPHEINPPDSEEDWNAHYLGAQLGDEPSLDFERLDSQIRGDHALVPLDPDFSSEYAVQVVTAEKQEDELLDVDSRKAPLVDYSEQIVVLVHSGYGSGSKGHSWQRVEQTDAGVHLHGYYVTPAELTLDYTTRHSVLRVDRPAGNNKPTAQVSLTISEDQRVHFDSTADIFGFD